MRDWDASPDSQPICCRKAHFGDFPCWPSFAPAAGPAPKPLCCPASSICMGAWPPAGSDSLPPTCCPKVQVCAKPDDPNGIFCCKEGEICVKGECQECPETPCMRADGIVECCTAASQCLVEGPSMGCCESAITCLQYPTATGAKPTLVCCNKDDTGSMCLKMPGAADAGLPFCCPKQQQCNVLVGNALQMQCCKPGEQCIADAAAAVADAQVCCSAGKVCESAAAAKVVCCGEKQQCSNGVCQP